MTVLDPRPPFYADGFLPPVVVPVAAYCRVSTDEQAEGTSLDDQERDGRGWVTAAGPGFSLYGVYRDDCTGTTDERPDWQRLLADVRAGQVKVIVVTKWDRWSRDEYTGRKMLREVEAHGVRVVCLAADLDATTPEGDLMRGQLIGFAAYDRKNIVRRCALGQHGTAERGFWPGSSARYGYRIDGPKRGRVLAPDSREDGTGEADALRHAWQVIVREQATYGQAAASLNAAGHLRRGGRAWDGDSLREVLLHRSITGEFVWGGPDATGKWGAPKTLRFPGVLSDGEHEQLLRAKPRRPYTRTEQRHYLLSTRLTAPCGATYTGKYRKERDLRQYHCQGQRWTGTGTSKCRCARLHADTLETRVWHAVTSFLTDPDRLDRMTADYLGLRAGQVQAEHDELARLRAHLARLDTAVTTAYADALRAGLDPGKLRRAVASIQAELDDARAREAAILQWQADSAAEAQRVATLRELATIARDRLPNLPSHLRADILAALGVRVTITDPSTTPALTVEGRLAWLDLRHTLDGNPTDPEL